MTRAAPGGALREGRSRPRSPLRGGSQPDADEVEAAASDVAPDSAPESMPDWMPDAVPAAALLPVRRRGRLARVFVAAVVAAGVASWVVLASPVTAVTSVSVDGVSPRWALAVRAAAEQSLGAHLPGVDPAAVAARVQAVPGVLRASVQTRWPHTLLVRVVERTPAVAVRVRGGVRVYDAAGVDLGPRRSAPGLPLVTMPAGPVRGATVAAAFRARESLPAPLRRQVVELGAVDPDGVWFVLRDGTRVLWGSADDAADKVAALAVMRSVAPHGHARTVDVSAPDAPAVS